MDILNPLAGREAELRKELPTYVQITWRDIETAVGNLAMYLRGKTYRGMVAISRGGLIPAGLLAQELGIHVVDTVCIKTRAEDGSSRPPEVLLPARANLEGRDVLVVDDLVDSGDTIKHLRQHYMPFADYAVLFCKSVTFEPLTRPHYVGTVLPACVPWLVFPWEHPPTAQAPGLDQDPQPRGRIWP